MALVSVRILLRNILHAVTLIVIVNYTEDEVKMSAKDLHFFISRTGLCKLLCLLRLVGDLLDDDVTFVASLTDISACLLKQFEVFSRG